MACEEGCLLFRDVYIKSAGDDRVDVVGYTLPDDDSKILLYKNGQLLVEGEPNAYNRNGNGFDLLTDAEDGDTFEVQVFC